MGRVPYYPDYEAYRQHYGSGLPVFQGDYYQQQGSGFLSSLVKKVVPLFTKNVLPALKSTAKSAGLSILNSGTKALTDVISGEKDVKTALRDNSKQALEDVKKSVVKVLDPRSSSTKGRKRTKRKRQKTDILD